MSFPNVPHAVPAGWNDPPKDVFKASSSSSSEAVGTNGSQSAAAAAGGGWDAAALQSLISEAQQRATTPMHQKMAEDARKRLAAVLGGDAVDPAAVPLLRDSVAALTARDFAGAQKAVAALMTNHYSHDASRFGWVLGLKRLAELLQAEQPM